MFEATKKNKTTSVNANQHNGGELFFKQLIQPKLTINEPGDKYEQEADEMAEKVMQRRNEPSKYVQKKAKNFFAGSQSESFFRATGIQAKLTVNQPHDDYEHEADAVAEKVVQRINEPSTSRPTRTALISTPGIQKKCADCEEEENLQREEEDDWEPIEELQMKRIFDGSVAPPLDDKNVQRRCSECDQEENLQRKLDLSYQENTSSGIEDTLNSSKGSGSLLPVPVREQMEESFGADFSTVRIYTDSAAVQMNKDLHAQAFTHGSDIYFGAGKYDANSYAGKHLLAHELTHVVQQELHKIWIPEIQRSAAADIVSEFSAALTLDEIGLGSELLKRASIGEYNFVIEALDTLSWNDRDDVCYYFMLSAKDDSLIELFSSQPEGRKMLDRIFDELTSGSVFGNEEEQADRIIKIKTKALVSETDFAGAITSDKTKIFPFKLPGMTVLCEPGLKAERKPDNSIWVSMNYNSRNCFEESAKLPEALFISGIQLNENEIIGVKMYDLGGKIIFKPALFLVQLYNQAISTTIESIATLAGFVAGGMGAEVAATTRIGTVLLWSDRIVNSAGFILTIIDEHRGWIIDEFGDKGIALLRWVDVLNALVAMYGGARALIEIPKAISGLASAVKDFRAQRELIKPVLSSNQIEVLNQIEPPLDDILESISDINSIPTEISQTPDLSVEETATAFPEIISPEVSSPLGSAIEPHPKITSNDASVSDITVNDDFARQVSDVKQIRSIQGISLEGVDYNVDFSRDLSGIAQGIVRKLEQQGFVRVDLINPEDLIQISKWFNREIGVLQSPYKNGLRLVLGTMEGVLKKQIRAGEVFVVHTHPVFSSKKGHFTLDIDKAGKNIEAVVDWSGQITYFNKTGILNPTSLAGDVKSMPAGFEAAFINSSGDIVGYAHIEVLVEGNAETTKVKVIE